jgi:hypothetical protein
VSARVAQMFTREAALAEYGMAVLSLLPLRGYRHPVRIFSQVRAVLP